MFDVFERTGDFLSSWLLALFNFEYGEFGTKLSFVISGRDQLDQQWTDLAGMICYIRLEPFTLEETKLYLSNQDITDAELSNQIYEDTGGLPVLIELLAATKPKPGSDLPDISKDAVERFLQWTPQEEKRNAALLAAVPRQFNRDILGAVLNDKSDEMFNWLAGQSYIRRSSERGWFYHEKVRELMLRYIEKTMPSQLINEHSKLAHYFSAVQTGLQLSQEDGYESETWCELEIEHTYHELSAHTEQNIREATNAFLHAFRWKWRFADKIARVCQQVAAEKELESLKIWSGIFLELYLAYERDDFQKVLASLNQLEQQKNLSIASQCCLFAQRGETLRMIGKDEEALADFTRAIELDDKYVWAISGRGLTYTSMSKYEEALTDFTRAIELDQKDGWAIAGRGLTYHSMGKYEEALADFTRAIELDDEDTWAISLRAQTYRLMGKYEEALADLAHAIELDQKDSWSIAERGQTYRSMGKHEEALADFTRAIELDDKYTWAIQQRAQIYKSIGKHEEALADFTRAIELNDKDTWLIQQRAQTYKSIGKYEETLTDFTRIIELSEKDAWAIVQRGQTYMIMKKYEEALADFTHAIELEPKYSGAFLERGICNESLNKYEDALEDFRLALEIDPDNPNSMVNYAGLLLGLGNKEQGLDLLNKAIQFLPEQNYPDLDVELWFYALVHWSEGQRATALKNLKQAILNGIRSEDWDFSQNLRQAEEDNHPDIGWLEKLDQVITEGADISILNGWSNWENT